MINTWVWIAWLVTALIALSSTRNPLYLVLILLCLAIVNNAVSRSTHLGNDKNSGARVPISPLRISVMLVVLSALFNAAISHYGETVLFHLPEWLPLIGGAITLEALIYGALNGLVLFGIFWTFMILNQALPSRRLLRLIPRAFYPVAVVTSIAITFVPATVRNYHQIREAQSIRGHRLRGLRDWLPLIMPLMVGGLERALALAEAMTARGFASAGKLGGQFWERTLLLLGTLLVLAGWILRLTERWFLLGNTMLIAGSVLIFGTLWILGRRSPRTTYARERWSLRDVIIILGMSLVLVFILIPLPFLDRLTLPYEVYPIISLPGFDPLFGVIIVALLLPTLSIHHQSTQSHS
jgi:energy-coupling factor transport system permease protein